MAGCGQSTSKKESKKIVQGDLLEKSDSIENSSEKENNSKENKADENNKIKVEKGKTEAKKQQDNNKDNNTKKEEVKDKKVKPKGKKTIVIDPGHAAKANLNKEAIAPGSKELKIKDGGGADGIVTKTPEHIINMKIAVKLRKLLEENGYNVVMTKTKYEESLGNIERAEIGNRNNADLAIRIHADADNNPSARGASILVPAPKGYAKDISGLSRKYGTSILNSLIKEVGMKNRGIVERSDLTGFNWSKVPVVLVEVGFLSNAEEDKLLNTEDYQNKIA